jgi:hypothetical protein
MTKACNARLESEFAEHPERFVFASDDEIAPWAHDQRTGFFWFMGAPIRLFHFIVWPMVFTFIMVFTGNHEFVVFPVIILLATGLIHSLDQITARHPSLTEIPGMESAILRVQELRQYYWDHEPHLRGSLRGMIRRARTEYAPYWRIAGIVVLAVVIDSILSFEDDYACHDNCDFFPEHVGGKK